MNARIPEYGVELLELRQKKSGMPELSLVDVLIVARNFNEIENMSFAAICSVAELPIMMPSMPFATFAKE